MLTIDDSFWSSWGRLSVLAILSIALLQIFSKKKSQFQQIGQSWLRQFLPGGKVTIFHADEYVQEGYDKIGKPKQMPFIMKWWAKEYIILPPKYLDDLRRADKESLSFLTNISDAFSLHHSAGDLYSSDMMADVVVRRLNPLLPKLIPALSEECDFAVKAEIGDSNDWHELLLAKLTGNVMHRVTSRILAGPELCRSEGYLKTSQTFTDSIMIHALILSTIPMGVFREVGSYLLTYFHRRNLRAAMKYVKPAVEKRIEERESTTERPSDAIEWTIELHEDAGNAVSAERVSLELLHNLWAGSAAPGGLVAQMIIQVLMEPEYLAPLQKEIQTNITEHGWTDKALSRMVLLDSFIRELGRLYPTGAIVSARTIVKHPFQFHDGLTLPVGTRIAFPAMAYMHDADNFENPLKFDGFRFARLEEAEAKAEEVEKKWSATTTARTNLSFGYGKHTCPGRFYAVRKVKLIFSKLILDYEFKFATKVKERPPNLSVNGQFAPNQELKVLVRKKSAAKSGT